MQKNTEKGLSLEWLLNKAQIDRMSKIVDIIDTAGTITAAARALMDKGAKEVYAACTHPLLSPPAVDRINDSPLKEVVCMNTIMLPEHKKSKKIIQLSAGHLLGRGVLNIISDKPLSSLFEYDSHKLDEE